MNTRECHELKTVRESLHHQRPVDETTAASVAVLAQRLEQLKQSSSLFAGVSFSPHVEKMLAAQMAAA